MDVLIISGRRAVWETLFPAFSEAGLSPSVLDTLESGLKRLPSQPPVAVLLDLATEAESRERHTKALRAALVAILQINASVHTAAVSFLDAEDFHDTFEGFGLLCSLPVMPVESDIQRFAESLYRVTTVTQNK